MGKTFNTGRLGNGLFVDANGNVGINTTTPVSLLHLQSGNLTIAKSAIGSATEVGNITFRNDYMGAYSWAQIKAVNGGTHDFSEIVFSTTYGFNSMSEKMRLTSSGILAIGTTSTSDEGNLFLGAKSTTEGGQLVLQKGTSQTYAAHLDNYTDRFRIMTGTNTGSSAELMVVKLDNGNVGIGTSSPVSRLEVYGDTNWSGGWRANLTVTANDYPTIRLKANNSGKIAFIGNNGDGSLYFNVNATESGTNVWSMVMSPAGNVSIGSTADIGTKLQVNGANYIEMATFTATAASSSTIVSNNAGYVQFSNASARYISNTSVFTATTDGIQILKAGIVHISFAQDVTSAGTTGYVAAYIRKNGNNISENLITNTNSQWDMITGVATINVADNDVINFYINASDILYLDAGGWSQYSFIWSAR